MSSLHPQPVHMLPLLRGFGDAVPEVARAITERIWAEIPSYATLGEDGQKAEVEEAARRNVHGFVVALSEGRELSKRDLDALGVVGETRAHQGVPLEDVLRAFRMVGQVLWDHLAAEMTKVHAPADVAIQLGGTLMRFTDQISSAVARHYSVAQRAIVRQQEAQRREFLHDLLLGTYSSGDDMLERAGAFGIDLGRPHIAIAAQRDPAHNGSNTSKEEVEVSRMLDQLAEKLHSATQPMVDRRGGQTIGLIALDPGTVSRPPHLAELLSAALPAGVKAGIGGPYGGLEGCRRSYLEAREALEIGAILDTAERVYPFESFILYRFLRSDGALVERFVETVLGPIIDHDRRRRSELVKTLDAYFATDASAREAGRRLFAHPHTITYRLKQIEKLTGRSLKDPEDKLHLQLALKALRLARGTEKVS